MPDDGHVRDVELVGEPLDELDVVPPSHQLLPYSKVVGMLLSATQRSKEVRSGCLVVMSRTPVPPWDGEHQRVMGSRGW